MDRPSFSSQKAKELIDGCDILIAIIAGANDALMDEELRLALTRMEKTGGGFNRPKALVAVLQDGVELDKTILPDLVAKNLSKTLDRGAKCGPSTLDHDEDYCVLCKEAFFLSHATEAIARAIYKRDIDLIEPVI